MSKPKKIVVQSKQTGLSLEGDTSVLEKLVIASEDQLHLKNKQDLIEAVRLWDHLKKNPLSKIKYSNLNKNLYRIAFNGFDPLDIAGSLSSGGRFNIGGAQVSKARHYFSLGKQGAIYGASNLKCAKCEVEFLLEAEFWRLSPRRPLKMINLIETIKSCGYPNIKSLIDSSPLSAEWELQTVPKISQLIAAYLMSQGEGEYDGLHYPSTKYSRGTNFCVYVKDTKEAKKMFKQQLL